MILTTIHSHEDVVHDPEAYQRQSAQKRLPVQLPISIHNLFRCRIYIQHFALLSPHRAHERRRDQDRHPVQLPTSIHRFFDTIAINRSKSLAIIILVPSVTPNPINDSAKRSQHAQLPISMCRFYYTTSIRYVERQTLGHNVQYFRHTISIFSIQCISNTILTTIMIALSMTPNPTKGTALRNATLRNSRQLGSRTEYSIPSRAADKRLPLS